MFSMDSVTFCKNKVWTHHWHRKSPFFIAVPVENLSLQFLLFTFFLLHTPLGIGSENCKIVKFDFSLQQIKFKNLTYSITQAKVSKLCLTWKQTLNRYIAILLLGPNIGSFQTYRFVYVVSMTGLSQKISLSYIWQNFPTIYILRGRSRPPNSSILPF